MKQIRKREWDGREWKLWSGSIGDLRQEIPTFTIGDFRMGTGINKYKSVIVREPYGDVDIGDTDEDDSMKSRRIPIEVVRKKHEGTIRDNYKHKTVLLGYNLVQHHDLLDDVLKTLKIFSDKESMGIARITRLTDAEDLEANLEITTYGARMRIEFPVPNYKYDVDDGKPYGLNVICRNSVDKRIAVEVNLYLYRENSPEIPFRGFYSRHKPEELKDGAIEKGLNEKLLDIASGKWLKATIEKGKVENLTKEILDKKGAQQILDALNKSDEAEDVLNKSDEAESDHINLYWFRTKLSALSTAVPKLELRDQQMGRIMKLLHEVDKVVEEETREQKSGNN